jgi:uncharacterized membrane protein YdjX (TVP38/TMEM64 family)
VIGPNLAGPGAAEISRARWRLGGLACLLSLVGLGLLVALALNAKDLGSRIDDLRVAAVPLVAVAGAILFAAMVPASVIAGAAGYALGTPIGTVSGLMAVTGGAALCAVIGRSVGTPAAPYAFGSRAARSVEWCSRRPIRTVMVARMTPGLPLNATSYVFGFARIRLRDLTVGTAVGFAPRCFAYAALGGSLRDLSSVQAKAALGASVLLLVLVVVVPRRLLRNPGAPS